MPESSKETESTSFWMDASGTVSMLRVWMTTFWSSILRKLLLSVCPIVGMADKSSNTSKNLLILICLVVQT